MKKVFVDANVLLDFWLVRPTGFNDAKSVLTAAEQKKIYLYTSPSLLLAALYFLKKEGVAPVTIMATIDKFLSLASLISPTEKAFRQGLYAGFADLEDGVQYHTALQAANLDYFITNNKKDFKKATAMLPVLTPKEFLSL
jgi:predicted nucleic acid-binding protein